MNTLEKAQQTFVDNLIANLEKGIIPWEKTWDSTFSNERPYNAETKNEYTGFNQLNLMMASMQKKFNDPRWMTFNQAKKKGYRIKKGAIASDIMKASIIHKETKKEIHFNDYNKLNEIEKKEYYFKSRFYKVFNAEHIIGIEKLPEKEMNTVKYSDEKSKKFLENLIEGMDIEIKHGGDRAYYSTKEDYIQLPMQNQFKTEQDYYATAYHELAHATSHESRLDRDVKNVFGSKEYAIEELNAELASVFISIDVGVQFDKSIEENHQAYIQNWLSAIKEDNNIIFKCVQNAQHIHTYLIETGKFSEIEKQFKVDRNIMPKSTKVINCFGGPGAGKTTAAWDIASALKKEGYVVEYVSEYAKELVWDEEFELLDGSLNHQKEILDVQEKRLERLNGKVDYIVTDAPLILNLMYLSTESEEYKKEVLERYSKFNNVNAFIQRAVKYEQEGRIQTLEESINLDEEIRTFMIDNSIDYKEYSHQTIQEVVKEATSKEMLEQIKEVNIETEKTNQMVDKEKRIPIATLKNTISIAEYAENELGFNVVKERNNFSKIEQHPSCKIYNDNTFYRYSRSVGGSIIDFIQHFEEMGLNDAINKATAYYKKNPSEMLYDVSKGSKINKANDNDTREFTLPKQAENDDKVISYLVEKRGINKDIVQSYIDNRVLYQDTRGQCVFLSRIAEQLQPYAMVRSTTSNFKQDVAGSDKSIGILEYNDSNTLVITEGMIDMMSYQSMVKDRSAFNYLSIQGVANAVNCAKKYINMHDKVIIALDNDEAGLTATDKLIDMIKEQKDIEIIVHTPKLNDFNEELMDLRGLSTSKEIEFTKDIGMEM